MNYPRKFLVAALCCGMAGAAWALPQQSSPTLRRPGEPQQPSAPAQPAPPPPAPAPPPSAQAPIRSSVTLVVVPVTVKDSSGDLVTGLDQRAFRIFEDGIEQEISSFSADPFPLSAAVLLDDDLKRSSADRVQQTMQAIAGGFSVGDPVEGSASDEVALWRFDDVPQSLSDFIAEPDALLDQLKRIDLNSSVAGAASAPMTGGPRINTAQPPGPVQPDGPVPVSEANNKHINDAIYAAAEQLAERPNARRKIIFIISDGQNARNNTHSYGDTLKECLAQNISVYAIAIGEHFVNHDLSVLSKYAHATGGDIYYASSKDDLEHLYSRTFEQARNQYTLAYVPAQTDRSKPYHAIEVRVERAGLILLARDGYYPSQTN